MDQSRSHGQKQQKRKKLSLCCVSRKVPGSREPKKDENTIDINTIKSIILTKKKTFNILTSVGSDIELSVSKIDNNKVRNEINFPPCEDIPGHVLETMIERKISEVDMSPLLDLQRNSDTLSDNMSIITLKDLLDQCDSPASVTPTFPGKTLYDLISLRYMPPRNRVSNYSECLPTNRNEFSNILFEDRKVKIQPHFQNTDKIDAKTRNDPNDRIYEFIESITLQPIGKGVTTLSSSSTLRFNPRRERVHFERKEPDSPIPIPPQMPLLPEIPKEFQFNKQTKSPSIINVPPRNLPQTFVSQSSHGFYPSVNLDKCDSEEIYQDIDRDFSSTANHHSNINDARQWKKSSTKPPPSTLCQNLNKTQLKRSSSAELSRFSHLPTKRSESNASLTKTMNYNGLTMNVEQSQYQESDLRHEF